MLGTDSYCTRVIFEHNIFISRLIILQHQATYLFQIGSVILLRSNSTLGRVSYLLHVLSATNCIQRHKSLYKQHWQLSLVFISPSLPNCEWFQFRSDFGLLIFTLYFNSLSCFLFQILVEHSFYIVS